MARHSPPYPTLFPFPCQVAALDRVVTSDALKGVEFVLSAAKLDFFGIQPSRYGGFVPVVHHRISFRGTHPELMGSFCLNACVIRMRKFFIQFHIADMQGVFLLPLIAGFAHPHQNRLLLSRFLILALLVFANSHPHLPRAPMSVVERASKMVDHMILILSHLPRPPRSSLHLGVTEVHENFLCRFPPSHARILKPLPGAIYSGLVVARDPGQICICIAKAIEFLHCLPRAAWCTWEFKVASKGGAVGRMFTHARSCCSCVLDCVASHTVNHKTARRKDHPAPKQEGQVLCGGGQPALLG